MPGALKKIEPGQLGPTRTTWSNFVLEDNAHSVNATNKICKTVAYFQNVETLLYRHISTFFAQAEKWLIFKMWKHCYIDMFPHFLSRLKRTISS